MKSQLLLHTLLIHKTKTHMLLHMMLKGIYMISAAYVHDHMLLKFYSIARLT